MVENINRSQSRSHHVLLLGLIWLLAFSCNAAIKEEEFQKSRRRILFEASMDSKLRKIKHDSKNEFFPNMPQWKVEGNLELLRNMFMHGYDSYMYHAYPQGELRPKSCSGGRFSLVRIPALTLIDSLDTLVILGNFTEFVRATERLRTLNSEGDGLFAIDQNVSIFETNIRILGGLLSAHQLAEAYLSPHRIPISDVYDSEGNVKLGYYHDESNKHSEEVCSSEETLTSETYSDDCNNVKSNIMDSTFSADTDEIAQSNKTKTQKENLGQVYEYDGILLDLAIDIGTRLLPAFETATGVPYGTVNLLHGVPPKETKISNLASAGTLSIEMELLSRLSGDKKFGRAAVLSMRALSLLRVPDVNLYGKHANVDSGVWTEKSSGIGSNADSFYEYLLKHYLVFPEMDADFWNIFTQAYDGIYQHNRIGDWYRTVDLRFSSVTDFSGSYVLESLMGFFPGVQVLLGELIPAARTLNSMFVVREHLGFLPENFNLQNWKVMEEESHHLLRPELLESCYFMHRATRGPMKTTTSWQWAADFALHKLESITRVKCGYASIKNVSPTTTGTVGHNFAELDNKVNGLLLLDEMPSYFLTETIKYLYLTFDENNILHRDLERQWVFTTEAHPIHHVPLAVTEKKSTFSRRDSALRKQFISKENRKIGEDNERVEYNLGPEDKIKDKVINLLRRRQQKSNTRSRIQKRREAVLSVAQSYIKISIDFEHQKQTWANKTSAEEFINDMRKSQTNVIELKKKRTLQATPLKNKILSSSFNKLYTTLLSSEQASNESYKNTNDNDHGINPISQEFLSMTNVASLGFRLRGKGDGVNLSKACPNFHYTKWQWVEIVDGLELEYMDTFIPTIEDKRPTKQYSNDQFWLFTAMASTALYSTNYIKSFLIIKEEDSNDLNVCVLNKIVGDGSSPINTYERTQKDQAIFPIFENVSKKTHANRPKFSPPPGSKRYDMGIGLFDISIFNDNIGFFVQHADTGEQIFANIFEVPSQTTADDVSMIMAELMTPFTAENETKGMENKNSPFESIRSVFREHSHTENNFSFNQSPERTVVFSDFSSNAFFCEVIIKEVFITDNESDSSFADQDSRELGYFACSAGTFGPTFLPLLSESKGITVEAQLKAIDADNPYGCRFQESSLSEIPSDEMILGKGEKDTCEQCNDATTQQTVQLVQRGVCAFDEKACVTSEKKKAAAMIVINSDGDKLFVMSTSGASEKSGLSNSELPASVLVTKTDGIKMLEILNNADSGDNQSVIKAVVRVRPQVEVANYKSIKTNERKWPHITARKDEFQILAKNGWGIHVTRKGSESSNTADNNWQLLILEHFIK